MGFFNKIFGDKKQSETDLIFKKIDNFLSDEYTQNQLLPENFRKIINQNGPCDIIYRDDRINNFKADSMSYEEQQEWSFGWKRNSPIPVNGPIGELIYISNLTRNGQRVFGHRIKSYPDEGVDVYETVSFDGKHWDILYFSPYYPRKSKKLPNLGKWGYLENGLRSIYATNVYSNGFPLSMNEEIKKVFSNFIGFPLSHPDVLKALSSNNYQRPSDHIDKLNTLDGDIKQHVEKHNPSFKKKDNNNYKLDRLLNRVTGSNKLDPLYKHLSLMERKTTEIVSKITSIAIRLQNLPSLQEMPIKEKCGTGLFITILSMAVNETLNQFSKELNLADGNIPSSNALKTSVILKQHSDYLFKNDLDYDDSPLDEFIFKVDDLVTSFLSNDIGLHFKELLIYRFEAQFNERDESNFLNGYRQHAKPELSDDEFYSYILKIFIGLTQSR